MKLSSIRPSNRKNKQLRSIIIETSNIINAEGSCLIKFGNTHVLCTATVENIVPYFLKSKNQGWVTAEYSMIPRATTQRVRREATIGRQNPRTQEIQRLLGRSIRASIDLKMLGERQIIIDCDVINADGGTRTAAITGGYVALCLAVRSLMKSRLLNINPLIQQVAAVSCGIYKGQMILDLDYIEDSDADVDANFVLTSDGKIIEIQGTAEQRSFSDDEFMKMLSMAKEAVQELFEIQNKALLI